MKGNEPLGRQLLLDLHGCQGFNGEWDISHIQTQLVQAVKASGGTIVREWFHEFSPHGVSGVVVIAESHVAVHTWPEVGVVAIDAFSCSDRLDFARLTELLKAAFGAQYTQSQVIERGGPRGAIAPA